VKDRIEKLKWHTFFGASYHEEIKEILMAFADSIAKLQQDVNTLIAENGPTAVATAVAAAVAAKDASDAAAVDAVDASVVAAITPAPAAAAPVAAPAAPAA
jgi:hypothetical protein